MTELKFDKEELQLIAFSLGSEEYTVPIESVQEIIMPQKTTHIPKSPPFIEGVINLRGHIIPILDGRKRFELPISENTAETRIIVLELENHTMGLIVDAVSEVVHLKTANIEPPPIETGENSFVLGVGKFKDRLLILLDPINFLDMKESESIQSTLQVAKNIVKTSEALIK
jgi:purine-binding chemotaxis protein CheW